MKKTAICVIFLLFGTSFGMMDNPEERQSAIGRYEEKVVTRPFLKLVQAFAEECAKKEEWRLVSVGILEGQGKGNQNGGIWKVEAQDSAGKSKGFVVKFGNKNEFLCSAILDEKLQEREIPSYIKFAYPRFAQVISSSFSGEWKSRIPGGKRKTFHSDLISIDLDGNEVDGSQPGKKFETSKRISPEATTSILSFGDIPGDWWERYSSDPKDAQCAADKGALLFMDEAIGMPGERFHGSSKEYPSEKVNQVYARLGESIGVLWNFFKPDDTQNLDNFMIDVDNDVITYIDFDKLHFYKDGGYYDDLMGYITSNGKFVNFDWYFPVLDRSPLSACAALYVAACSAVPDLRYCEQAQTRIGWIEPAIVIDSLEGDTNEFMWEIFEEASKFDPNQPREDAQCAKQFIDTATQLYSKRSLDRTVLLSRIISEATDTKIADQFRLLYDVDQDYVRVLANEGLISEGEMWAIQIAQWISPEDKALLGKAYVGLIPKIVLRHNTEEEISETVLVEKLEQMREAFRRYEQENQPTKTVYGGGPYSGWKAIRVL